MSAVMVQQKFDWLTDALGQIHTSAGAQMLKILWQLQNCDQPIVDVNHENRLCDSQVVGQVDM